MTRQIKTPRQRAEEALAVADRRYRKALKAATQAQQDLEAANTELEEAKSLHKYAGQHPALQNPSTTSTTPGTTPPKEEGKA